MSSPTINAFQAVQNAQNALQRGDKLSARRWAELAASLAPEREEPWLLLAAVANPQASVEYLKQALKVNPNSPRAQAGMEWALKRVEKATQTAATAKVIVSKLAETAPHTAATVPVKVARPVTSPPKPANLPENAKKSSRFPFFILLPILLVAVLALSIWNASPVLAVFSSQFSVTENSHAPSWAQVGLVKATMTLAPTATSIPTATVISTEMPTVTSSPPETFAATLTAAPTASPTPIELTPGPSSETDATPTPLPTDTGVPAQSNPQSAEAAPANFSGKWILVDISEQHMYAYEGDTLIYSFIASTGMGNSTRVGTFSVLDKIPNAYGATWNIWMPNWLGIYYAGSLENGIHALPILSNGATLWAGYLGTPISFGCVVLGSYESQQLYDWAEIGTPVKIQR
jgi:hypothetical protein